MATFFTFQLSTPHLFWKLQNKKNHMRIGDYPCINACLPNFRRSKSFFSPFFSGTEKKCRQGTLFSTFLLSTNMKSYQTLIRAKNAEKSNKCTLMKHDFLKTKPGQTVCYAKKKLNINKSFSCYNVQLMLEIAIFSQLSRTLLENINCLSIKDIQRGTHHFIMRLDCDLR